MLSFHIKFVQTDRQTDRQTMVKQYPPPPDLSIGGIKRENAGNQHFPIMFSTLPKTNFNISTTFILSSANAFNLNRSKISSFGKELRKGKNSGNLHFFLFLQCFIPT